MNETFEEILATNFNYIKTVAASLGFEGNEDLIQVGRIALWNCYNNFNPEFGTTLMQYAGHNIRNQMKTYLTNNLRTIRIPQNQLRNELSKGVEEREFNYYMLSTDKAINDDSNITLGDTLTDKAVLSIDEDEKKIIYNAISKLKPKYREIIQMRYGINQPMDKENTLSEIGNFYGESKENIRLTLLRAERKLKELLQAA